MKKRTLWILFVFLFTLGTAFAQCAGCADTCKDTKNENNEISKADEGHVRFLEFGSVNCIPCKQMKPVMKAIEETYGSQIEITFYDVNKEENQEIRKKYKIRLIPTQIFLDTEGKEIHRHEGFYPENKIHELLNSIGLKAQPK